MEIVYFLVAAVAVYFGSDWILNRLEAMRGERLAHRDIIFFIIFLVLVLSLFALIRHLTGSGGETP